MHFRKKKCRVYTFWLSTWKPSILANTSDAQETSCRWVVSLNFRLLQITSKCSIWSISNMSVWRIDPGWMSDAHWSHAVTPPPQLDRGEKVCWKKPGGQSCTWRQRKTKYFFSTSHQQPMSNYFPGNRASIHIAVALEDKHSNKCPLSSFLLALLLSSHHMVWNMLWSVCGSCSGYASSQDVAQPRPTGERECWRGSLDPAVSTAQQ